MSETVCDVVRPLMGWWEVGGCRFDGGAVLVRHVPVALRLLQRNSLARPTVRKRGFIITKSRIRFQTIVNTSEIVVRAVSFQIISWGDPKF